MLASILTLVRILTFNSRRLSKKFITHQNSIEMIDFDTSTLMTLLSKYWQFSIVMHLKNDKYISKYNYISKTNQHVSNEYQEWFAQMKETN